LDCEATSEKLILEGICGFGVFHAQEKVFGHNWHPFNTPGNCAAVQNPT
jgi:hypothetical protein